MNEVCQLFELLTENRPAGHQPIVVFFVKYQQAWLFICPGLFLSIFAFEPVST
jgi:hypothetical protein